MHFYQWGQYMDISGAELQWQRPGTIDTLKVTEVTEVTEAIRGELRAVQK